jgi:hypothetical protein
VARQGREKSRLVSSRTLLSWSCHSAKQKHEKIEKSVGVGVSVASQLMTP